MSFIIIVDFVILFVNFHSWWKSSNKIFIVLTLWALANIVFGIREYPNESITNTLNLSGMLLVVASSWYHWKMYKDSWFLYFFWVIVIASIYPAYKLIVGLF